MAKMYTLDEKLLVGTPEIRIGEKIYPVDNRVKNVKKIMKISKEHEDMNSDDIDKLFELAFGPKNAKEVIAMDLPFPAYQKLATLVMAALTGEEPKDEEERFQKPIEQSK